LNCLAIDAIGSGVSAQRKATWQLRRGTEDRR
jgi:hypothetical protein